MRKVHTHYVRPIHFRENWRGYFWQGRFRSFVMDQEYLLAATRYVLNNPVRAKLVSRAAHWSASSAQAQLRKACDKHLSRQPLDWLTVDWESFMNQDQGLADTFFRGPRESR